MAQMRIEARPGRGFLAALALLSLLCLPAATCDTLEFAPSVELDTRAGPRSVEVRQPTVGRLGADVEFINRGEAGADVELLWLTRTSGSRDDVACAALRAPGARNVDSPLLEPGTIQGSQVRRIPLVRDLDNRIQLGLSDADAEASAEEGALVGVRLELTRASEWRLHLPAELEPDLRLAGGTLPRVPNSVEPSDTECEAFRVHTWELEEGTWILRLPLAHNEERIPFVLSESCERARRVPRTCPGSSSEIQRYTVEDLPAGERALLSIDEARMGIGDVLDLTLQCAAEGCSAAASVHLRRSPIECVRLADCAGSETCTPDGYCVLEPAERGCAQRAGPGMPFPPLVLLLVVLLLLLRVPPRTPAPESRHAR